MKDHWDDQPKVRQAHPMMATPQAPTRITVSGGPKAEPHLTFATTPKQGIASRILAALRGKKT